MTPAARKTLAARVAPRLPTRAVAALARLVYPRFEPELARLGELCPPDCGTAVDVGGWYGPWSRRLARRARRVVTVEPVPHLARLLAAATPGNVRVIQAAAGEEPGTARLWLPEDDRGDRGVSSLVRRDGVHGTALDVPCLTLDGLGLHDVHFIKIDVEGAEMDVLRGARRTLAAGGIAAFMELHPAAWPSRGVTTEGIPAELASQVLAGKDLVLGRLFPPEQSHR